jgi:hypothetical protein
LTIAGDGGVRMVPNMIAAERTAVGRDSFLDDATASSLGCPNWERRACSEVIRVAEFAMDIENDNAGSTRKTAAIANIRSVAALLTLVERVMLIYRLGGRGKSFAEA